MSKWVAPVVALVLLGACGTGAGDPSPPPVQAEGVEEDFGPEEIGFGEALAQIRGHHDAAVALYKVGETDQALVHAGDPIDETFALVSGELDEHAAGHADDLGEALSEVKSLIESGAGKREVTTAAEAATELTFEAEQQVVGEVSGTPPFVGSIVAALVATAAHEYEEAVAGGDGIGLLEEYQDGYAFTGEAKDLYETIVTDVEAASQEEAHEIEEAFDELEAAFPSLTEPEEVLPAAPVEDAAELIGHELEETVDAQLLEQSDPDAVVENIERLLDEVVAAYEAGDPDAAGELAAEAYLENYEVIEAEVIENAPEVNEELEPLLGADLRKEISEGVPVSDIEAMVARARELLAQALEAVEAH